uniref:Sodium-dependent serotonin transporter n=1 Tax=Romanomermis culicivorax TaxID=13658 RepID=A0A915HXV3_ROMCU
REVLEIHKSSGLDDLGNIKWTLALCLVGVYTVVYFALWKGPKSSGKAVWITATMPYIILLILLVHGLMLPGADIGIKYYLTPNWSKLTDTTVWIDAATQIFFSLGPGFGVLLALSSYNDFHNNCYKDAILTSFINCVTCLLSGLVIFSTLGYMSTILGKDISEVAGEGGPGLVFIVYPQAIATMKGSSFWAVIFFFMLITLGIDSTFAGLEALVTAFCDEFPHIVGRYREFFVLGLVTYCYFGTLPSTTYGGNYLVDFLDFYGVSFPVLFVVAVETIAVCWFYGVERFSNDVYRMLGFVPGIFWRSCWMVISPVFILVIFLFACVDQQSAATHHYPRWAIFVGWMIRMSSISCIPLYMLYHFFVCTSGSFRERIRQCISPYGGIQPMALPPSAGPGDNNNLKFTPKELEILNVASWKEDDKVPDQSSTDENKNENLTVHNFGKSTTFSAAASGYLA